MKFITEGSGASTKYYVQLGADAASKKLLGSVNVKLLHVFSHNSSNITYAFSKAVKHGVIVSGGHGAVGSSFGFIYTSTGTIQLTKLIEKYYDPQHCISAYEFKNASVGDTVSFNLSTGAGGVVIELE